MMPLGNYPGLMTSYYGITCSIAHQPLNCGVAVYESHSKTSSAAASTHEQCVCFPFCQLFSFPLSRILSDGLISCKPQMRAVSFFPRETHSKGTSKFSTKEDLGIVKTQFGEKLFNSQLKNDSELKHIRELLKVRGVVSQTLRWLSNSDNITPTVGSEGTPRYVLVVVIIENSRWDGEVRAFFLRSLHTCIQS